MSLVEVVLKVLFRWAHVVAAAVTIGGVFYMRIVLPIGLRALPDPAQRTAVFLRCRRVFKMAIHTCILLLLASGVYNTIQNWGTYVQNRALMHGLWGMHLLLGLAAMGVALWLLGPTEPPPAHAKWSAVNLGLLLVIVALAGVLKGARESAATTKAANDARGAAAPVAAPTTAPTTAPVQ